MATGILMQAPLACEVCDDIKDVDWFCDTCVQNMCDACKTLHLRFKGSKDHKILPIFEGLRQVKLGVNLTCDRHGNQQDSYCKTCSSLVCDHCKTDDHASHSFCSCEELSKEKIKSLEEFMANFKNTTMVDMKYAVEAIQYKRKRFVDNAENLKSLLASTAESVKSALCLKVDNLLDVSTQEVQDNLKTNLDVLKSQGAKLKSQVESFEENLEKYEKQSSFHKGAAAIKFAENVKQELSSISMINPLEGTQRLEFKEGDVSKENIQKCFGELIPQVDEGYDDKDTISGFNDHDDAVSQNLALSSQKMRITDLSSFIPKYENTSDLCILQKDEAWIGLRSASLSSFYIQHITRSGKVLKEIPVNFNPFMMTSTKNGNLLVSNHSCRIRMVSKDFSVKAHKKVELNVFGITVTGENELLLSLFNDDLKRDGKVVRERINGDHRLQEIQYDDKGQLLYRWPKNLTENVNGDIWTLDNNYRAVVVDRHGQYKFTYKGFDKKFDARYIVHDNMGHVLITDFSSHRVHVVSKSGDFIQYILTRQDNLVWPAGIGVYNDQLWVAGSKILVGKYTLDKQ